MEIPYFLWIFLLLVLNILTLTFDLIYFLEMTLVITSKLETLELSYTIWAFLVTRSSYWYQDICPGALGHIWNRPLSGAFVFHKHILFLIWTSKNPCPLKVWLSHIFTRSMVFPACHALGACKWIWKCTCNVCMPGHIVKRTLYKEIILLC